jgi:hypothetical protein
LLQIFEYDNYLINKNPKFLIFGKKKSMIVCYNIPFSRSRKIARTWSKIVQLLLRPIIRRRFLKEVDARSIDYLDIPVIINNYNRVNHLKQLIEWLENAGMRNIFIIDNASTYPPLLDYYQSSRHTIIRLNTNIGYKSVWDTNIHLWFRGLPYIYTDPDVLPVKECPNDAVKYFQEVLQKYPEFTKVGFGIKIDDLPDYYKNKKNVLNWESKYWTSPIGDGLFKADIDTTFALYRANSVKQQWGKTLRTSGQYMIHHLPWYENESEITDEEKYYRAVAVNSTWYSSKWQKKYGST